MESTTVSVLLCGPTDRFTKVNGVTVGKTVEESLLEYMGLSMRVNGLMASTMAEASSKPQTARSIPACSNEVDT
jgi:hypothetical protein